MCFDNVYKYKDLIPSYNKKLIAYKLLDKLDRYSFPLAKGTTLKPRVGTGPFHSNCRFRIGETYTDTNKLYINDYRSRWDYLEDGTKKLRKELDKNRYLTGYHCYRTLDDAKKAISKSQYKFIVKVELSRITAIGDYNDEANGICGRRMKIIKTVWSCSKAEHYVSMNSTYADGKVYKTLSTNNRDNNAMPRTVGVALAKALIKKFNITDKELDNDILI